MTPGPRDLRRDESGSMLLLTIFYGMLCLAVVLMAVAATSLYLERKRLFTLADASALAGAEAFELSEVEVTPSGPSVTLQPADIRSAVDTLLANTPPGNLQELSVEDASSPDGRSVVVTLSAYWQPPVLSLVAPAGFRIEVTAVARSVLG